MKYGQEFEMVWSHIKRIEKRLKDLEEPIEEKQYPCADCGKLRTKAEGGTTFTVYDKCWDKRHKKPKQYCECEKRGGFGNTHLHEGRMVCNRCLKPIKPKQATDDLVEAIADILDIELPWLRKDLCNFAKPIANMIKENPERWFEVEETEDSKSYARRFKIVPRSEKE